MLTFKMRQNESATFGIQRANSQKPNSHAQAQFSSKTLPSPGLVLIAWLERKSAATWPISGIILTPLRTVI